MIYISNKNKIYCRKKILNNILKMLIIGNLHITILSCIVFFFFEFPLSSIFIPLLVFSCIYYNFGSYLLTKRWNHTIQKIEIYNAITIYTSSIFRSKPVKKTLNNFTIKEKKFSWYGDTPKDGIVILLKQDKSIKEYYLVKDFFEDYIAIIADLRKQ